MTMAILTLDLGTHTGWALRHRDGTTASGTEHFQPHRFEGGGMRYLRFKRWLDRGRAGGRGLDAVYFEEVRRHAGRRCRPRLRRLPGPPDRLVRAPPDPLPGGARGHDQEARHRPGQRRQGGDGRRDAGQGLRGRATTTRPTPWRCCTGPWPRRCDMAHPPGNYRCPLGRLQPQVTDLEEVKRTGWREQQILVVSPEDERLDWVERELRETNRRAALRPPGRSPCGILSKWPRASRRRPTPPTACPRCGCRGTSASGPRSSASPGRPTRTTSPSASASRPSPAAIDRMVETMHWVGWLDEEQRHLVWMRAEGRGWRTISQRFGCDRTTAWRRWRKALGVVAGRLNCPGCSRGEGRLASGRAVRGLRLPACRSSLRWSEAATRGQTAARPPVADGSKRVRLSCRDRRPAREADGQFAQPPRQ